MNILREIYKNSQLSTGKRIGVYRVDAFIEPNIVFEINGYSHYMGGASDRNTGYSEIKMRNLKKLGYNVKEIILSDVLKEKGVMKKVVEIKRQLGRSLN